MTESSPRGFKYSLATRLKSRVFRIFHSKFSSLHISQSFFKSLADVSIGSIEDLYGTNRKEISHAKVIHVRSDFLLEFLSDFGRALNARLLLVGSSDLPIEFDLDTLLPKSVLRAYVQNSLVSDNQRIFTLPIGIEDLALGLNGLPSLMTPGSTVRKRKILIGPFSLTHPERTTLLQSALNCREAFIVSERCSPKTYSRLAQQFQWIACPAGNGMDTHRLWESLYRGSIPVVKRSHWSSSLSIYKLPLLEITSWSNEELHKLTQTDTTEFTPEEIPPLWQWYWVNLFKTFLY